MKKNDINKNYENQKLDNNFNYNQNEENKFKNILSKDKPEKDFFMMDEKDIKKINEEIENLKQNQKDETPKDGMGRRRALPSAVCMSSDNPPDYRKDPPPPM